MANSTPSAYADYLVNKFISAGCLFANAKTCAGISIDETIDAIKTTTGHCTLRLLDRQEVASDISYYEKAKEYLQTITL
jgi:hypothetical protein